ncbi:hypothetical protein DFJ58DRAFT_734749 [Suillus subalutaceus]|uniref:uncharacterized protein n=1 Tax=Suillus subalutaceus TaxID=48586 RepID=UPI001B86C5B8|nr:uncharacterized protein DFJ58DRAFT_734749 [Suillus subalutaceus]KAG1836804.1 hypothetical protein DFJ58DRAFT_734749 [Suillus subalutaceus]
MTDTSIPGPPRGAGGKNTDTFISANNRVLLDSEINQVAVGRHVTLPIDLEDHEVVAAENLAHANRNAVSRIPNTNHYSFLNTRKTPVKRPSQAPVVSAQSASVPITFTNPNPNSSFTFPNFSIPLAPTTFISDIPDFDFLTQAINKVLRVFSFLNTLTPNTVKRVVGALTGSDPSPSNITVPSSSSSTSADTLVFKDADMVITKTADTGTKIPRPILNLAKAKIHVPLTLLTLAALQQIHLNPTCVKMKKGLILDDPKKSVMDTSIFPAESTLPADRFYKAYSNFLKMMALIADEAMIEWFVEHRDFCLSRDEFSDNSNAVLNFDIEICWKFFNSQTFCDPDAYMQRWNKIKINTSLLLNWHAGSGR